MNPQSSLRSATAASTTHPGAAEVQVEVPSRLVASDPDPAGGETTAGELTAIGGVRLRGVLGRGGMGIVYLGRHETLDIDVAVKVMKDGVGDAGRFLNEVRLAARVQHPNVVRTLHAARDQGRLFMVMEYVPGRNLKQVLQDNGPVPWKTALLWILQAARGLAAAHHAGIVHRDLKPSNLLIGLDGVVRIADLGLARETFGGGEFTETGHLLGTANYMAPEQARNPRSAGPAADIYALGVTLFHLLTGEVPFAHSSAASVILAHIQDPPPDLRSMLPDLPESVAELITRMLAKDPANRPGDGRALTRECERLLGLASSAEQPPSAASVATELASPRRRTRLPLWLLPALAAAGLALAWAVSGFVGADDGAIPGGAAAALLAPPQLLAAPAPGWATPPRAVCLLGRDLPAGCFGPAMAALARSGLRVVEREQVDSLVREQDFSRDGRLDPATMLALQKLIGNHLAVIAVGEGGTVNVRAVLIETGELAGFRAAVAPGDVAAAVSEVLDRALAATEIRARIEPGPNGDLVLGAGSQHGVRVGDRFSVHPRDGEPLPEPSTTVTVSAVAPTSATLKLDRPPVPMPGGRARKLVQ